MSRYQVRHNREPVAADGCCLWALTEPLPEECLFDAYSASSEWGMLRTTEGKRVVGIARGPSAMPELHGFILHGRTLDEKRKLVRELTEVFVRNLNVAPEAIMIRLIENAKGLGEENDGSALRPRRVNESASVLGTPTAPLTFNEPKRKGLHVVLRLCISVLAIAL